MSCCSLFVRICRQFCEADIDTLLARGSRVIEVGDAPDAAGATESRMAAFNFSKTSFQAAEGDADLDFNDPDFWRKVLSSYRGTCVCACGFVFLSHTLSSVCSRCMHEHV